jgi:BlaI family penicillinase repressor
MNDLSATGDFSKAEYAILNCLWKKSPLSVKEVFDQVDNNWAYTTTKTVMDRMVAKGLLIREKVHGVYVYRSRVKRSQGITQWVRFIADKVLEIDREQALNMFISNVSYSDEEIKEMMELLHRSDDGE